MLLLFPLLLVVTFVRDVLTRSKLGATRTLIFALTYLVAECIGLCLAFVLWLQRPLRSAESYQAANYALQRSWTRVLFFAARTSMSLKFEVSGNSGPAPMVLLMRHVGVIDTLFPSAFVAWEQRARLLYVLKRELLNDPCLDVIGNRIPNAFVGRDGSDEDALLKVRTLGKNLQPNEGVLIFPEGTRFTKERRARSLRYIADHKPEDLKRAEGLEHTLLPRPKGTLALLEATTCDVVFCAHTGAEGFESWRDLLNGTLVGRIVKLRFWRVSRSDLPITTQDQREWLFDQWEMLDSWISDAKSAL